MRIAVIKARFRSGPGGLIVWMDRLIGGAYHTVELLFEVQCRGDFPSRGDQGIGVGALERRVDGRKAVDSLQSGAGYPTD